MTLTLDNTIINHESILALAPQTQAGLSTPLLIDATSTLGGDAFRIYTGPEAVTSDQTAGELSAFAANALRGAFLSSPRPSEVMVASVDGSASPDPETYVSVLDKIRENRIIVGFTIDSREASDIVAVAQAAAARNVIFAWQTDAVADLEGGELPAALSDLDGLEFCPGYLHPDGSQAFDFKVLARNLKVSPDTNSRNWTGQVNDVTPYPDGYVSDLTSILEVPVNVIGEFGGDEGWVYPGKTLTGRPISELVTAIWFDVRWKERVSTLFKQYDVDNEKFPINIGGQNALKGEALPIIADGIDAGHFVDASQVIIDLPAITAQNRDDQEIPIDITIQTLTGAIKIASSVTYSRQPIVEDE